MTGNSIRACAATEVSNDTWPLTVLGRHLLQPGDQFISLAVLLGHQLDLQCL